MSNDDIISAINIRRDALRMELDRLDAASLALKGLSEDDPIPYVPVPSAPGRASKAKPAREVKPVVKTRHRASKAEQPAPAKAPRHRTGKTELEKLDAELLRVGAMTGVPFTIGTATALVAEHSRATISNRLRRLVDAAKLQQHGWGRYTTYTLPAISNGCGDGGAVSE